NGAYVRRFSAGYAAVNPGMATVTVNLGGTYTDLDGHVVQQAILPPHTGMVFTTSSSTGPTTTTTSTTALATTTTTTAACIPRRTTTTRPTTSTTVKQALRARRCKPRRAP